jgi:hypothetical protein
MSHPRYVAEHPLTLPPGVAEMISSAEHYRRSPMEVVDYSKAPPEAGAFGWEPLLDSQPEPEPEPSYFRKLWAALRGKT